VAVGSLYQYFPDKRAIVAALAERNMQAFLARLRARLASGAVEGWRELTEAAIDDMIDMHRTVPGFRTLRFGDLVDRNLLDEERNNDTVFADELSLIMAAYFDMPDGPQLRTALLIAVELGDALVRLAFRRDPQGDPVILAEARLVVCDYLAQKLP
jgi:AcrR family transcriptional regulator